MMMPDVIAADPLVLDGALTMRTAEAVCTTLRATIARHADVLIDCTGAEEVDLSFVQLLVAARMSAAESGKTVALAATPGGALLDTLTRAGFRVIQEDQLGESKAFWFEGAVA